MGCSWAAPAVLCSWDPTAAHGFLNLSPASGTSWASQKGSSLISLASETTRVHVSTVLWLQNHLQTWWPFIRYLVSFKKQSADITHLFLWSWTFRYTIHNPHRRNYESQRSVNTPFFLMDKQKKSKNQNKTRQFSFYLQAELQCSVIPLLAADYLAHAGVLLGKLILLLPTGREIPKLLLYGNIPGEWELLQGKEPLIIYHTCTRAHTVC